MSNTTQFETVFGVRTIIDASVELVTLTKATRFGDDYLIRLRLHPNQDLNLGWQTASQRVPAAAFDVTSLAILNQFIDDSANFVRRPDGALASKNQGGNSYTLRVVSGLVQVNEMENRTNPSTGLPVRLPGSFSHSVLSLAPMGQPPKSVAFDPNLGAPAPAPAKSRRRLSA